MAIAGARTTYSAIADGAYNAFRFVKASTTKHKVAQAAANDFILGVGPDYDVSDGVAMEYAMEGSVWIQLGTGGGSAGNYVKSDADGKAVELSGGGTGSENENVGGILMEGGSADEVVQMAITRLQADTS